MTASLGRARERGRPSAVDPSTRPARGYWEASWERLRRNRLGVACGTILIVHALIAILAPVISGVTGYAESTQDLDNTLASPSAKHLLGTDELGRDIFTRLVWGGRISLGVGFLSVALYILIGGTVGLLAGYYGGLVDDGLMRLVDVLISIPTIYLLILITSLLPISVGPADHPLLVIRHDAVSLAAVIAITAWTRPARLIRGEALSLRERDFVVASRAVGAKSRRLIFRHILPNAMPVMIVTASLGVPQIILVEAGLDFIGLGIQPPAASWGNMLISAQRYFYQSTWLVLWPGFVIVLAVLSANIFGNAVRDAFDPRV
jgi:peptide/nickel transport system permease protein